MNKLDIEIEYIYNSGFTLNMKEHFLVFDYYLGDLNIPNKNTTFFVSHAHKDHYNKDIFAYKDTAKYVISDDVEGINEKNNIRLVKPGDNISFNGMDISVFDSTDQGSSFLIEVGGLTIFHGGDLNWWAWDDSTEEKELEREENYKREIDRIKGMNVDIAFVPMDPRLDYNYHLAVKYFLDTIDTKYLFPMHFRDNYDYNEKFLEDYREYKDIFIPITHRNQVFNL